MTRFPAFVRGLRESTSGVAVIEFAFVFPVLLTLYIGTAQLCAGVSAYRKVTTTTRAIADLTAQYTSVSNSDLDTVLAASSQIMAPFAATEVKATVSQISMDVNGTATVSWSRGMNTTALAEGTAFTIPAAIRTPNSSLIVSDVNYTYKPGFMSALIGNIPVRDRIVMSPRSVVSIVKKAE